MSSTIKSYKSVCFGELNWCINEGIMYQRDVTSIIPYDAKYFEHYVNLENSNIAKKLNIGRTAITQKYCKNLLDVGVGSGEFIKSSKIRVWGYDINPVGVEWLKDRELYVDPYVNFPDVDGLTFWDTLEHIPDPDALLSKFKKDMFAFISIPIFSNLSNVRKSKHYKPGEHLVYFTLNGIIRFMNDLNFEVMEIDDFETQSGRENILTFVFRKL